MIDKLHSLLDLANELPNGSKNKRRAIVLLTSLISGPQTMLRGQLTKEEIKMGQQDGKLSAVKAYKERTGLGLLDSKRDVEDYFAHNSLSFRYQ